MFGSEKKNKRSATDS